MKVDYTLYLVTDSVLVPGTALPAAVEQAILGGCTMVQLREKARSSRELFVKANEVKAVTDRYDIPLIINNSIDIAMAVHAAGVHIGQRDMPPQIARRLIGDDMLLGVSVTTVQEAIEAERDGADYLGVGAIFPTPTKSDAAIVELETLKQIRNSVRIPMVAIGGIDCENAALFKGMGIDGLAVVSAILSQQDIRQAAARLKQRFDEG